MSNETHVVILGCGFAGQGAAQKLKDAPVKITIVDQNDYHTFQPLLYQLATNEMGTTQVGFPIRELMHQQDNAVFHQVKVTGIDLKNKQVQVTGMEPIAYDYLVVGLGAVVNFFGTKGAEENAFPLYTLRDAVQLKNHILKTLEATDKYPAGKPRTSAAHSEGSNGLPAREPIDYLSTDVVWPVAGIQSRQHLALLRRGSARGGSHT